MSYHVDKSVAVFILQNGNSREQNSFPKGAKEAFFPVRDVFGALASLIARIVTKAACMAKSRTIKQGVYIRAPPEKVFRSLTEPRLLRKWFLSQAKFSPRKGGNYQFAWHGGYTHSGKVLDYLRDKRLSLSWPGIMRGKLLGNTRVTFRLKPKNDGTFLEMTHTGFKAGNLWIELYGAVCSGWAYFLTNMKSVIQHGRDLRSPEDKI